MNEFVKKSVLVAFLFFCEFIKPVFGGLLGPCLPEQVKEELMQMELDPDIIMNIELLNALKVEYGEDVVKYLTSQHPYLSDPSGHIDPLTLHWAAEAIWSPKSKITRYMLIVMDLSDEEALKEYISLALQNLFNIKDKTKLVFFTKEDFNKFKSKATVTIQSLLLSNNPNMPDIEILTIAKAFKKHYLGKSGHMIGFEGQENQNKIITIEAHGDASSSNIALGHSIMSSDELINRLQEIHLPNDAIIRLDVCFSGCTTRKLDISKSEIVRLFTLDQLTDQFESIEGSFLDTFSRKLYQAMPAFNGNIEGYIGRVISLPKSAVLRKNGTLMPRGNAVEVMGLDGAVLLKKEETLISLSRKDAV